MDRFPGGFVYIGRARAWGRSHQEQLIRLSEYYISPPSIRTRGILLSPLHQSKATTYAKATPQAIHRATHQATHQAKATPPSQIERRTVPLPPCLPVLCGTSSSPALSSSHRTSATIPKRMGLRSVMGFTSRARSEL